jgi:hypothetical protein
LRVFDLTLRKSGGAGSRHVTTVSLAAAAKSLAAAHNEGDDDGDQAEGGLHILAIACSDHDDSAASSLAAVLQSTSAPWLVCATPAAIFVVHGRLFTTLQRIDVVASPHSQLPYVN